VTPPEGAEAEPFEDGPIEVIHAHPSRRLDAPALTALMRRAAAGEGFEIEALSLVLADHATVRALNVEWLDHDYDTDVLSFAMDDDAAERRVVDGEVYVDLDTAWECAEEFGQTPEEEARRYAVHGLLHLMGYDDATPDEKAQMHRLEDRYLDNARG
jgi:rRNA maturation RNase YbeY